MRTLISFALLSIGLVTLVNSSRTISRHKGLIQAQLWEQHLPGSQLVSSFFPNLKRDLERLCKQHRPGILGETHNRISSTRSLSASHVISEDILPTNALLDTDNLCQLSKSSGTDNLLQLSNLQPKMQFNNKVEYSFSVKNSDTVKSVNGRLVKCVEFWTNELTNSCYVSHFNCIVETFKKKKKKKKFGNSIIVSH